MIKLDGQGRKLSAGLFADAYRTTIPVLADAKHVTIRLTSTRGSELAECGGDVQDVVEVGTVKESVVDPVSHSTVSVTRVRAIAVPISVHVKDGAEVVIDDKFDPTVISFEINGRPEVQIVNLKLSAAEQAAADRKAAADKAKQDSAAKSDFDKQLEDAKEQGKKEALLEQAKQAGRDSVAQASPPPKVN